MLNLHSITDESRMVGVFCEKVFLAQANGPEAELVVSGTELYATYQTPEGFPAIYDDALGLFCYARLAEGKFQSTGVPVTAPPPPGVERHATESDSVRMQKIAERTAQMERRGRASNQEQEK
jgi:hypothetical protein